MFLCKRLNEWNNPPWVPPRPAIVHPSFSQNMKCFNGKHGSVQRLFYYLFLECDKNEHTRTCWSYRSVTIFLKEQEWLFPLSRYEMQKVLWAQNKGGHMGGAYAARSSPCWLLPGSERCRTPLHPHCTCSTNCPQPVFNPGVATETPRPSSVWLGGLLCFFVLFFLPCLQGVLGLPWFGF